MTKILLVEDDKSLREIYGVRLLAEGYDIVSAGDGEEALAMAIKERPNLIVSDVMMPKISGFDMLDILRSTTETRGIKVIMMTALSSEDQRRRGEALGADRYLVKSQVGIEDVVRTVHEVLEDGDLTVEQRTAQKQAPIAAETREFTHTEAQQFAAQQPAPIPVPQPAQNPTLNPEPTPVSPVFERPIAPQVPAHPAINSTPVRAAVPSLAQFERERPAPQAPIQMNQNPATIEAPARPISDFVNQPRVSAPQPVRQPIQSPQTSGERIIQPIENNRSNEETLTFQINDILNGGSGENPLNNQQPPFGAQ